MRAWWRRRSRRTKIILGAVVAIILIVALVPTEEDDEQAVNMTVVTTQDSPAATEEPAEATTEEESSSDRPPGYVSEEQYGSDWPLTVRQGVLSCEGPGAAGAVYFTSDGRRYAVNGIAAGKDDAPEIDAIWADDPDAEGLKINIGPLIQRGLELCD